MAEPPLPHPTPARGGSGGARSTLPRWWPGAACCPASVGGGGGGGSVGGASDRVQRWLRGRGRDGRGGDYLVGGVTRGMELPLPAQEVAAAAAVAASVYMYAFLVARAEVLGGATTEWLCSTRPALSAFSSFFFFVCASFRVYPTLYPCTASCFFRHNVASAVERRWPMNVGSQK